MDKDKILIKIRNLEHDLEYYKKVYPGNKKINNLRNKIYYYKKKLVILN